MYYLRWKKKMNIGYFIAVSFPRFVDFLFPDVQLSNCEVYNELMDLPCSPSLVLTISPLPSMKSWTFLYYHCQCYEDVCSQWESLYIQLQQCVGIVVFREEILSSSRVYPLSVSLRLLPSWTDCDCCFILVYNLFDSEFACFTPLFK